MTRRGFTLMELVVCMSIFSIIAAGAGHFLLQARRGAAAAEARVQLDRSATLALERVGTDIRNAREITSAQGAVHIERASGIVVYELNKQGLVRRFGGDTDVVGRRITDLQVTDSGEGLRRVSVVLRRPLGRFQPVVVRRASLFARRQ